MNLYKLHLKLSDGTETDFLGAAKSLQDVLTQSSDFERKYLRAVEFIAEYESYESCVHQLNGEVNLSLVEVANLANAADNYRDWGLSYELSEIENTKEISEQLSIMLDVIESKVNKAKEYMEMIDAVIRGRADLPRSQQPQFHADQ